jgi:hypothetical protein
MAADKASDNIYADFKKQVNMTAAELEKWLDTEESKSVGQDSGDGTSIGHKSGEQIITILRKKKDDLTAADEAHMHKVHSYISRHSAQGLEKDVGHDPLKK